MTEHPEAKQFAAAGQSVESVRLRYAKLTGRTPAPFWLTDDQVDHLCDMKAAERRVALSTLRHAHGFNDAKRLRGGFQLFAEDEREFAHDWAVNGETYTNDAEAVFNDALAVPFVQVERIAPGMVLA